MHLFQSNFIRLTVFSVGVSLGFTVPLRAETTSSWINTSSPGNWSEAANWNPAIVPNGDYSVTIAAGSSVVTVDNSPTINHLTIEPTGHLKSAINQTLTTTQLTNSGYYDLSGGGGLTVIGKTDSYGDIVFSNNNVGQFQDLNLYWNLVLMDGLGWDAPQHSNVTISGTLNSSADAFIYNSGNFLTTDTITSGGYLFLENRSRLDAQSFSNAGSLAVSGNSVLNINGYSNSAGVSLLGGTINWIGGGQGVTQIRSTEAYFISGGIFNVVNQGNTTSAFDHLSNIDGELSLDDGRSYTWPTLDIGGTFFVHSTVTVNSLNMHGQLKVFSEFNIDSPTAADISHIPSGAAYTVVGSFNVVRNGIKTNAIRSVSTIDGELSVWDGKNYTWPDLVVNGSLSVNGNTQVTSPSLTLANLLSIGASGKFNVGSNLPVNPQGFEQFPNGRFVEVISSDTLFGTISTSIDVKLSGTLDIQLASGYVPLPGEQFVMIQTKSSFLSGVFDNVIGTPYAGGYWYINYDNTNGRVTLTAFSVPEPTTISLLSIGCFGLLRRRRA